MILINKIPRRAYLQHMISEELEIYKLIEKIEALGADILLTECVILLQQAKDKLSDWVELNSKTSTKI